ncbi:hypothetical protein BI343_08550 [Chromobacterium amazonense]|nr:hypothetical protein BI343_08550 [Chromobacterium amazonense]
MLAAPSAQTQTLAAGRQCFMRAADAALTLTALLALGSPAGFLRVMEALPRGPPAGVAWLQRRSHRLKA